MAPREIYVDPNTNVNKLLADGSKERPYQSVRQATYGICSMPSQPEPPTIVMIGEAQQPDRTHD
jgi:hypothetical protein